jgi:hypothetical protein
VVEGPYAKRKIWSLIGLYSPKGPDWANMGRGLIRGILNSARGVSDKDNSPEAQLRRRISGFGDLDGIEFVARIDIGTDANGDDKNEVRAAVTPDHKDYAAIMGMVRATPQTSTAQAGAAQSNAYAEARQQSTAPSARPSWAQ